MWAQVQLECVHVSMLVWEQIMKNVECVINKCTKANKKQCLAYRCVAQ